MVKCEHWCQGEKYSCCGCTRDHDICLCEGDRSRCDFYDYTIEPAAAEKKELVDKKSYKYNEGFEAMKDNICDTSCGIIPAPMDAQTGLDILTKYLLGKDYYIAASVSTEQANAIVVEQILDKYSRKWKKDWKRYEKTCL